MARRGSSKASGRLARNLALAFGGIGILGGLFVAVAVVQNLAGAVAEPALVTRAWTIALVMALFASVLSALGGFVLGGRIASRIVEIGLAVSKLGRSGAEVKVRVDGNDEVAALGRSVQYLSTDLAALQKEQDQSGGAAHPSMDPLVRQLRDRTVPNNLPPLAGHEVDGQLAAGSRGGLDYFDLVPMQGEEAGGVLYLVAAEGHGALAVLACRQARDELHRALLAGANPRKALAHANKVMKQNLPVGCCAVATLLQVTASGCKLYQAGARAPLLICQRAEVLELNAEGIALGLDDGPVFEKALRPQEIAMSPGIRLVLGNDALHRSEGLLGLLRQHSPRHTNMFMNVVLGGLEQDAGDDGLREDLVLLTVKRAGQA
ncbi:MAG: hypothetical protein FJ265_03105 [Planctomycetes bacterium]|nr:hypothetical protein [Planctomycetota bacterium]